MLLSDTWYELEEHLIPGRKVLFRNSEPEVAFPLFLFSYVFLPTSPSISPQFIFSLLEWPTILLVILFSLKGFANRYWVRILLK